MIGRATAKVPLLATPEVPAQPRRMKGGPFVRRISFLSAGAAASALTSLPARSFAAEPATDAYDLVTTTGTIYGTLQLPAGASGPLPVALIVAGSGPTDRDGNSPSLALQIYRKLAAALAEHDIASVRYDKRGIAASRAAVAGESDLRFETYVDDATAYVEKLRADQRFDRVTVVGHSEGSLIGMIAAQRASASAFVSIAGAGFPAADVLVTQLTDRLASRPDLLAAAKSIIAELAAGRTVPANRVPPELAPLFHASVQPYLISWLAYDPRVEIAKLTCPVTIIQGSHDVQVGLDDAHALAAADPKATYVQIDELTHVLTDDPGTTLAQQLTGAYADASRPLDRKLVRTLVAACDGRS